MVGEDVEFDDEEPSPPPARSYRLLGLLSVAAVATVIIVPYSGLSGFGTSDLLTSDATSTSEVVDEADEPEYKPPKVEDADPETEGGRQGIAAPVDTRPVATTTTVAVDETLPRPAPPPSFSRPVPTPLSTTTTAAPPVTEPPWADSTRTTAAGYIATDVGCADGTSAADLDEFFRDRMGPVLGHDYQHVYRLGDDRYLWLFQDTFIDQAGVADELDEADFVHNAAMVQTGRCFTLYHRGSASLPSSFEPGKGETLLNTWFWPLGGELVDDELYVFWAEMEKDEDPPPGDGLGWHPTSTWLARYDAGTLARLEFAPAPDPGTEPIYGYAVASDSTHTYLFGNTYDQNLARQGGWRSGPHSATEMWLARVPRGRLEAEPEYRTARGWSDNPSAAVPFMARFWAENPMQPRYLEGQWVAATKRDGFWGDELYIDVARDPWGPWTTVSRVRSEPRGNDPLMTTYHAHLLPWLDAGALVVSLSQNARDMVEDAFPHPERYRLQFVRAPLVPPPPEPPPPTTTTTTAPPTTRPPRPTTTTKPPTTTRPPSTTTTTTTTTTLPPSTSTPPPTSTSTTTTTSDTPTTTDTGETDATLEQTPGT